ncbi:hypothetical protein ACKKBG_A26695 [Auxenochlorella protothecoides x Auxenochlorella symbiontica]|nr:putative voltage-gated potassium channel subunit beta [Auxenochlorella protothecoides]KFM25039.1 putative voltage-gated potassium channel subunit beta [Auxenochlorella protothecoides]
MSETPKMVYKQLGKTGLKVSALSYGAWVSFGDQLGLEEAKELLKTAYDAGINYFDNAENYSSGKAEILMGKAFKELGWKREDIVVATKVYFGSQLPDMTINAKGLSRKHIVEGVQASLARLQLEYVDLLLAHRPDPSVPMEEVVRAFNHVLDRGWAFYWGTSEWTGAQLLEAWEVADRLGLVGPAVEQPEYNIFQRHKVERDFAPVYEKHGLGLTVWSPLASGILTGKYSGGNVPEGSRLSVEKFAWLRKGIMEGKRAQIDAVDKLKPIAERMGATPAQLALAWCAANPRVSTVITGSSKRSQLEDNLKALNFIDKITDDVKKEIDDIVGDLAWQPRGW